MAVIFFVTVMWWVLLMLAFVPIGLIMDMNTVIKSGFSTSNIGFAFIGSLGLMIGLSLLIPPFRRMYYALPWLFPFVKIFYLNVVILSIATIILNKGFEVQNEYRHIMFIALMIIQIILCRFAMCIYLHKKPVRHIGGAVDE